MEVKTAPYGAWRSPITTDLIVSEMVVLGGLHADGEDVYWQEMRPQEAGRVVIVRRTPDGDQQDVTLSPFNARTTVHEYGGKAYTVRSGVVYFSNFADQRLYVTSPGDTPRPLTPQAKLRYADLQVDMHRNRMIAVREDHRAGGQEATNTLVSISLDEGGEGHVLVEGNDFYASPRLSPDGTRLAWLTWNHPNLPWDGCELWVGELEGGNSVAKPQLVAGGVEESIFQPTWSPGGEALYFISDRTGWWNLYGWEGGQIKALLPMEAEFGQPQWVFGLQTYSLLSERKLLCSYNCQGRSYLGVLDLSSGQLDTFDLPYTFIQYLNTLPGRAVFIAGSPAKFPAVVLLDLATRKAEMLQISNQVQLDPGYISTPQEIEYPTENGLTAHAFFYPPRNRDYLAPEGERPPLLVHSHGGPTSATNAVLDLDTQYWTSRGFAVLDVNYGGSTGYGRPYRERLNGQWGVVDVDDCANGARYLAEQGLVDVERMAIAGGSAGGYTTLCALTFRNTFTAGASHFGIGDLELLATETHKFESRYLDRLVGPYPERKDLYYERSPINFLERLNSPLIITHGLEDKVVPPVLSERIYEAVRSKGLPVAYLPFAGEQHGYRKADTIKRALEAEFYFYSKVFGFQPADPIEPVPIDNLGGD